MPPILPERFWETVGEKFLAMESLVSLRSAVDREMNSLPKYASVAIQARKAISPSPEGKGVPSREHWLTRDVPGCEGALVFSAHVTLPVEEVSATDAAPPRGWIVTDIFAVREDGEVVHRKVSAYDYKVARGAAGDLCVHCGADNGPHGEDRNGYDCGCCGGN